MLNFATIKVLLHAKNGCISIFTSLKIMPRQICVGYMPSILITYKCIHAVFQQTGTMIQ